jgi:hypothetical protein
MESWLTSIFRLVRSHSASRLDDQCVTPIARNASGGADTVADRISAIRIGQYPLRPARTRRVLLPGQPVFGILPPPLDHRRLRAPDPLRDLRPSQPGGQQHDPGPFPNPGLLSRIG